MKIRVLTRQESYLDLKVQQIVCPKGTFKQNRHFPKTVPMGPLKFDRFDENDEKWCFMTRLWHHMREHFLKTFPVGHHRPVDHCCTSVRTGQKSLVISETGRSPVRSVDLDRFRPFGVSKVSFFVFFRVFHKNHEISEKGCITAGF